MPLVPRTVLVSFEFRKLGQQPIEVISLFVQPLTESLQHMDDCSCFISRYHTR